MEMDGRSWGGGRVISRRAFITSWCDELRAKTTSISANLVVEITPTAGRRS